MIRTTLPTAEPITLDDAKLHLRLDPSEFSEDALIAVYISAAREHVENELGLLIDGETMTDGTTTWPVTAGIRAAMLITLGALYEARDTDAASIPGAVAALVDLCPYKQRTGAA